MDRYAVIGHPIKHSLSPLIHSKFAQQTKQNLSYEKIEAPLDQFKNIVKQFKEMGGKGANVTLPFKIEAYEIANNHSLLAKEAGAANVLLFQDDDSIFADSTDGVGIVRDLMQNHHFSLQKKRILILGAGGAVRTILGPILHQHPSHCVIANRTLEKAIKLAAEFQKIGLVEALELEGLSGFDTFDLIINATSAGLTGEFIAIPNGLITTQTYCYDLMYGAKKSSFLHWAQQNNAAMCLDGLGMLVEQAAESFFIWRGIRPDTQIVLKELQEKYETDK